MVWCVIRLDSMPEMTPRCGYTGTRRTALITSTLHRAVTEDANVDLPAASGPGHDCDARHRPAPRRKTWASSYPCVALRVSKMSFASLTTRP